LGAATGEVRVGALKLAGGWSAGDADWQVKWVMNKESERTATPMARLSDVQKCPARLGARRPSGENLGRRYAKTLFSLDAVAGAEFGSAVHKLFSEVEWGSANLVAEWQSRDLPPEVLNEAKACLRVPALAGVWTKPTDAVSVELWRERAFEVVLDAVWVTGVFDRVVVQRDENGRAKKAVVYDFKTDRFAEELLVGAAARHAGQLELYCRVVAVLTGLNLGSVEGELIFTQWRRAVPIPLRVV